MNKMDDDQNTEQSWYKPWDKHSIWLSFLGFFIIAVIIAGFTVFFDIIMIKVGYIFIYFVLIFLMTVTYFFCVILKTKGVATILFGINGIIGIPIEYVIEWQTENTLKSPWGALFWGFIYIGYGLSIDITLWLSRPVKDERRAVILSSLSSSLVFILLSVLALTTFYKSNLSTPGIDNFLTYWYFMIPYSIIEGAMGGFIGWYWGNSYLGRFKSKKIDTVPDSSGGDT